MNKSKQPEGRRTHLVLLRESNEALLKLAKAVAASLEAAKTNGSTGTTAKGGSTVKCVSKAKK